MIGDSMCVPVTDADEFVFAVRKTRQRSQVTRFVKNRQSIQTNMMTIIMKSIGDKMQLLTAYFGAPAHKEPTDPSITPEELQPSIDFWKNHALILNPEWVSEYII